MSKLHFLSIIVSALLYSCNSTNQDSLIQEGGVVIAGKIISSEDQSKTITLNYSGGSERRNIRTVLIDTSGVFQFEFNMLHPQDVSLHYEDGSALLYVGPSDSLFLVINAQDFLNTRFPNYRISGTNSRVSKDILAYHNFKMLDDFKPKIGSKTTEKYVKDIYQHIRKEDSVLSAFCLEQNPDDKFIKWASKNIIYRNANYLIYYKFHHFTNKTTYEGNLFDTDIFPVNNDEAIISSKYGAHLWHYSTDKYIQGDSIVADLLYNERLYEAYELCLMNILNGEKPGLSRDIMSFWILSALFEESFQDFSKLWDKDIAFISDKNLKYKLQDRKKLHKTQKNYSISLIDPESNEEKEILGDFFHVLEKKHQGKVIYIDIWATWCAPCRSEIPHAIELHNYFHDKPIVFVNLCMNSEKTEWKKAMENQHIAGENYYFDKMQSGLLRNKLKWQGFPTYMIIDKNGNIVDENASRPSSDKEIKMKLIKFMGE